ncbi:hypothetical protein N0V83_001341 [Neocucurbitaria cava]|uniref:Uncharacterized protein n=1 Tax=Neocucurbitaria cava TaxID=798079 RepID=A0A9W9CRA1_9PLEO|nr:hypothetical protein N0V83_001341 [Neocucurbitaria cava]
MKLYQLLLLAAAASPVLASDRAAGYEAVMFYDIYRMDGLRPEGDRTIATGCKGAKGGRCNFAEFITHIQSGTQSVIINGQKATVGKFNPDNVPKSLDLENPDINEASKIMDWKGWLNPQYGKNPKVTDPYYPSYDGKYDQKALLGKMYNSGKVRDKHGDVLTKLGKVTQDARSAAGSKGDDILKRINTSLDNVILGRQADNADSLVRDLDLKVISKYNTGKNAANPKIEIPTTDYKDEDTGKTYKIIDATKFADDIKNHPSLSAEAKTAIDNAITEYVTNYTNDESLSEKAGSNGVTHHRDIKAAQAVSSTIKAPLPASC